MMKDDYTIGKMLLQKYNIKKVNHFTADLMSKEWLTKKAELLNEPLYTKNIDKFNIIGLEIEVEGQKNDIYDYINPLWSITHDGSLRDNGVEYISWPIKACYSKVALDFLFKAMLNANPETYWSDRTSIHVHINIQPLTRNRLENVILNYLLIEGLIPIILQTQRSKYNFCVPLIDSDLTFITNAFGTSSLAGFISTLVGGSRKYAALNFCPIIGGEGGHKGQGSIEFRHLHGTNDVNLIVNWIRLICDLVYYSKLQNYGTTILEIKNLNCTSYYVDYLKKFFPNSFMWLMEVPESIRSKKIYDGCRVIKGIL